MSVENWGSGKPDYFVPTISSRPSIISEQTTQQKWVQNTVYTIGGYSSVVQVFYTVPIGYKLQLGSAYISANNSVINKFRVLDDSTVILGDFRYDMRGDVFWSSLDGQSLDDGHDLLVYLWNNDNDESEISLTISGVLERT